MNDIKFNLEDTEKIDFSVDYVVKEVYPPLENLEITPSTEEQVFNHENSYGYDEVKVNPIPDEYIIPEGTLEITENGTHNVTNYKEVFTDIHEVAKYKPRYIRFSGYSGTELDSEIENLDTSLFTKMNHMFSTCSFLTNIDLSSFDTSNVSTMANMFSGCSAFTNIDLSSFDTSNVTNMTSMFYTCKQLTTLNLSSFDTSNVTDMTSMFNSCTTLTQINLNSFNTSKVTSWGQTFANCLKLTDLNLSNFDFSKATYINGLFNNCKALTNLDFGTNLGKGYTGKSNNSSSYKLDLSTCTLLTHDSLMSVINNLYDLNLTYNVANGGTLYRQSLVLGATNLAKLTEEEIAIATNKGWNVS